MNIVSEIESRTGGHSPACSNDGHDVVYLDDYDCDQDEDEEGATENIEQSSSHVRDDIFSSQRISTLTSFSHDQSRCPIEITLFNRRVEKVKRHNSVWDQKSLSDVFPFLNNESRFLNCLLETKAVYIGELR